MQLVAWPSREATEGGAGWSKSCVQWIEKWVVVVVVVVVVPVDVFVCKYSTHTQTHYNQRPKRDTLFPLDLPDVHLIMSLSHSFIHSFFCEKFRTQMSSTLPSSLPLARLFTRAPSAKRHVVVDDSIADREAYRNAPSLYYTYIFSSLLLFLLLKRSCYMRTAHWSAQMPRAHNIHFSYCLYVQYRIVVDWYRSCISSTWSIRDVLYLPLQVLGCHRLTMGGETTRMRK